MHKATIFIIQLCVVVKLFSLKDACSFIAETASFYAAVESGGSMRMVNTMVITLNICMTIRTLSETDNSGINSDALLLVMHDGVIVKEC